MRQPVSTARKVRPLVFISAWGAAVALTIGLVGVARAPYSDSTSVQKLINGQLMRMDGLRRDNATAVALEESQVLPSLQVLVSSLEEALPPAPDEVRMFFLVQLLAHALEIELENFSLGDIEAQGLPIGKGDVGLRSMSLVGTANLGSVLNLLEALRVAGLPLTVHDLQAVRSTPQVQAGALLAEEHKFSLSLSLIEYTAFVPVTELDDGYALGDETGEVPQDEAPHGE